MKVSRVFLQLSILLVGLCQAHCDPPPDAASASGQKGGVPVSQLRMLSLGLAHLLHGVAENNEQLEQQRKQVLAELDGATQTLESLLKQRLHTGRTHRQVRKDLQISSAKGDRLQRMVKDLQKVLKDLETEQGAMQCWINWILQKVKSLTEPRSGQQAQLDISSVKDIMNKQAKQLASLTSEVSARDRLINRRLQHIEHLEKQVSERLSAALKADSESDCAR
ncbi:hypothetical protein EXN66_Car017992 [Channa argus]|uniref:Uncharacterized protein n=1 Tax=Channa argus TaxID=215402 RepID=A0A6G1QIM7_CHAAH|nr:hypothetical protein EXN66_Car017992 [Channa argus]KAK2888548.1 hypothetical protein Q8A73_019996 [Channa argus]